MKSPLPGSSDEFYAAAVKVLQQANLPFLVGGAYALRHYTDVIRDTKDFDVFLQQSDLDAAMAAFRQAGYHCDVTFSHWLAKVHYGEAFIDLIYRAGNGLCEVTDEWFSGTTKVCLWDTEVALVKPEDIISQKAYIMERERFDGADVAHLLRCCVERLDWEYLLRRFGPDWRVLASHLVLFGFIYPGERSRIPPEILNDLLKRLQEETDTKPADDKVCQGTLISRAQYLPDIERWGYGDARLQGRAKITVEEIEAWTSAIGPERAWN